MLQNVPQFYVSLLAIWLVGGIVVPLNTMYRERELRYYFRDSGCRAVICLESFYEVVSASVPDSAVEFVVTASELDGAPSPLPFALSSSKRIETPGAIPLIAILTDGRANGSPGFESDPSKPAVLSYTSGTTGPAKGAVNTHANLLWNACAWERYLGVEPSDTLFAIAPLFHITGLVAYVMTGLVTGIPVVLTYRFDPETALGEISRWRATVTVAAITAFVALLESPQISRGALQSLSKAFSGGAPVPEAVIKRFEEVTGHYIHNAYGLTETSSLCIGVPLGTRAPIDSKTGAVSVGRVVPGLFTGDLAIKDNDSWIYVLDRTKDIINTSGYKVWPREVEDVLYEHPAVREACVVGVADQYRGEAVHAVIATRVGAEVPTQDELIAFCRSRLAAFKCPRGVTFVDEVPKTTSGKLLRRELRRSLAESLTLGRL